MSSSTSIGSTPLTASLLEVVALYPLDVAITRHQARLPYVTPASTFGMLRRLHSGHSMFRGISLHIVSSSILIGIRHFTYRSNVNESVLHAGLLGAMAGALEGAIISPIEAIKLPMQIGASPMTVRSTFHQVTEYGRSPIKLFRGVIPTMLRQSTYGAITFSSIGFIQDRLSDGISKTDVLTYSCIIGTIAAIAGSPFDVIKTRSQSLLHYPSHNDIRRQLFSGLPSKLWRVALGTVIFLVTYDEPEL